MLRVCGCWCGYCRSAHVPASKLATWQRMRSAEQSHKTDTHWRARSDARNHVQSYGLSARSLWNLCCSARSAKTVFDSGGWPKQSLACTELGETLSRTGSACRHPAWMPQPCSTLWQDEQTQNDTSKVRRHSKRAQGQAFFGAGSKDWTTSWPILRRTKTWAKTASNVCADTAIPRTQPQSSLFP